MAVLENIIKEIGDLQEAKDLLQDIFLELGPYTDKLSDNLRWKINDYFAFDDSE